MFKKNLFISLSVATLIFSGCSGKFIPDAENPIPVEKSSSSDKVDLQSMRNDSLKNKTNINRLLYPDAEDLGSDTALSKREVVKEIVVEDEPPIELTRKKIENMEMFSAKLGNIFKLILSDVNVNLIIEPNVNLNTPVSFKISNKNIYEAMRNVAQGAGYYVYYDANRESLIVSRYVMKKYFVPSEVFVKRSAQISFGSTSDTSSSITPEFDMNNKPAEEILKDTLKQIGSTEKIVNIDPQSGVIVVKERPNYISEIDSVIEDFVYERIQQFNVELAVVEVSRENLDKFGMDIADISKDNFYMSSLAGTPVNSDSVGKTIASGGVIMSTFDNYTDLYSTTPVAASELAFKMVISALKQNGSVEIVEKPNIIVQNHSIGYISVGNEVNYVRNLKVTPGAYRSDGSKEPDLYEPEIDSYRDGLQFVVKVDKYRNRDRIGVSLAPILAFSDLVPYNTGNGGQSIQLLNRKIRETMNVVTIKDGDIIILGGMKINKGVGAENKSKLLDGVPVLDDLFGVKSTQSSNAETLFIVKVNEIRHAYETQNNISTRSRDLLRSTK